MISYKIDYNINDAHFFSIRNVSFLVMIRLICKHSSPFLCHHYLLLLIVTLALSQRTSGTFASLLFILGLHCPTRSAVIPTNTALVIAFYPLVLRFIRLEPPIFIPHAAWFSLVRRYRSHSLKTVRSTRVRVNVRIAVSGAVYFPVASPSLVSSSRPPGWRVNTIYMCGSYGE